MRRATRPSSRARNLSRRSACAALALAAGACAPAHARVLINAAWAAGNSANWNTNAAWSPAGAPNNGVNTFNVTIAVAPVGANYTVTNNTATTISTLFINQANATLLHSAVLFTVLGNANVAAGTFRHTAGTVDINGGLNVGANGVLAGTGTWDITGGDLINEGVIRADVGGGMNFLSSGGAGIAVWDLDGASGAGELDASVGSIAFNGTLNDSFDGTITIGAAQAVLMTGGWALNAAEINLNGSAAQAATIACTAGAFSSGATVFNVDKRAVIDSGASIALNAGGLINITDADDSLTLTGTALFLAGTNFTGMGTLSLGQNSTTTADTTISIGTLDWDGTSGSLIHTINAGNTLTINANQIDLGVGGGQFDGTINNNGTLAINLAAGALWTLGTGADLNMGAGSALNGTAFNANGLIGVASGIGTINAEANFDSTPGITLDNAADDLRLFGGGSFSGGTISGAGTLRLDGNWDFTGATTINSTLDFDGTNVGIHTYTVGPAASLLVSSSQSGDPFGDDMVLTGGTLNVSNAAGWTIDSFGSLSLQNSGANLATLAVGGAFRIDGDLIALAGVAAGSNSISMSEFTTFGSASTISVASGVTLRLAAGGASEGGSVSGLGTFSPDGNWTISGAATWGSTNLDWDSLALGHTFTINSTGSLTINSHITEAMDDDIVINNATLTVNDPSGWTFGSAAMLTMNDTAVGGSPILAGSAVTMNGTIDVNGTASITAPIIFDATPSVLLTLAADKLFLGGGGEFHGGTFTGAGTLSLDGDFDVLADTTFSTGVFDIDGQNAGLIDTFRVASNITATVTSDISADFLNDIIFLDGGDLAVTNAAGWTLANPSELRLRVNGASPTVSGGPLTIAGNLISENGASTIASTTLNFVSSANVSIPTASDLLIINGTSLNFAGGTYTGMGTMRLETNTIQVTADTTINVHQLDWDGVSSNNTTTINAGVQFNILSDFIDLPGDGFGGIINLNNSTLRVVTAAAWELGDNAGAIGTLNMGGGNPIVGVGSTMNVSGRINVNSVAATIFAPVSFLSTAVVDANIAADRLLLNGLTTYSGGSYTGLGIIVQNGAATVASSTTIGTARYDWDGFSNNTTTTVNPGATFTLNGGQIDESDNVYNGMTNNSGTVVVETAPNAWTIGAGGAINLATAASRLEGDFLSIVGLVSGQGTLATANFDNQGAISATNSGTLRISSTTFGDLDGSNAAETGVVNAVLGSVQITSSFGGVFGFNGNLNIGAARSFSMATFGLFLENGAAVGGAGTMTLSGGTYNAPLLQHEGVMNATSGASTLLTATQFLNTGATTISGGAQLRIDGSARVDPGHTFSGAGTLVVVDSAFLTGTGSIGVAVQNSGHVAPGNSVGALNINNTYTQLGSGAYDVEISGNQPTNRDILTITGAASLSGRLNLALTGGFVPDWGDNWTIMSYASRTGDFNLFTLPALAANLFWWREVNPTIYRVGVRLAADTDHDGDVDFSDLNRVLGTFGQSMAGTPGMMGLIGDANEDGLVNFVDLNLVLSFFGQHAPANFAVPAPGAATLVLIGMGLTAARRRRERHAA